MSTSSAVSNISGPITVLFYEGILGLEIHSAVLDKLPIKLEKLLDIVEMTRLSQHVTDKRR